MTELKDQSAGGDRKACGEGHIPDPRCHAYRSDLAAQELQDVVKARRYTEGAPAQVIRASMPLRSGPKAKASIVNEALFGETVRVFDEADGWAWVQLNTDGYVGYLPANVLSKRINKATHHVRALGTFVYPVADIKAPPVMHLSLNSRLAIVEAKDGFCRTAEGGFVSARHVALLDHFSRDFVEVAERFIGTPYLWGGRTRIGIDCSGLVQMALMAAGLKSPRDSDMQQVQLGATVLVPDDLEGLVRGDLIFWDGHVGIMVDGIMILHANAHHMAVTVETLPEAVARIEKTGSKISAIKRLSITGAGVGPPALPKN